jgi:hypothetical protein
MRAMLGLRRARRRGWSIFGGFIGKGFDGDGGIAGEGVVNAVGVLCGIGFGISVAPCCGCVYGI